MKETKSGPAPSFSIYVPKNEKDEVSRTLKLLLEKLSPWGLSASSLFRLMVTTARIENGKLVIDLPKRGEQTNRS